MERFEVTEKQELPVKRFHIPLSVRCKCPKCNTINVHDFTDSYLSYPKVNEVESVGVYCTQCDDYFDQKLILRIAIELV